MTDQQEISVVALLRESVEAQVTSIAVLDKIDERLGKVETSMLDLKPVLQRLAAAEERRNKTLEFFARREFFGWVLGLIVAIGWLSGLDPSSIIGLFKSTP